MYLSSLAKRGSTNRRIEIHVCLRLKQDLISKITNVKGLAGWLKW
jgi:hypothetical protein